MKKDWRNLNWVWNSLEGWIDTDWFDVHSVVNSYQIDVRWMKDKERLHQMVFLLLDSQRWVIRRNL